MTVNLVGNRITNNSIKKVMDFILKAASRYKSIKNFNLPITDQILKYQIQLNQQV